MFIHPTPEWQETGAKLVDQLTAGCGRQGLAPDRFGLVVAVPGAGGRAEGFAYRGDWRCYPCSLVKVFHLVHALHLIEAGRIAPHADLDRALRDMILWSSNTATNYVIDLVTGTTGDTRLEAPALTDWMARREALNRFFATLGWPEFAGCNITQKLMDDRRYGREAQYAGPEGQNLNALTPLAAARLMWELFEGSLPLGPGMRRRAQDTLRRDRTAPEAAAPQFQLDRFLGAGLPDEAEIWSKAGLNLWTGDPRASYFKHDLVRYRLPGGPPVTLLLMTAGRGLSEARPEAFPAIARTLHAAIAPLLQDIPVGGAGPLSPR